MQQAGAPLPGLSQEILNRRSRPYIIVLDPGLRIVCAENRALECLSEAYPAEREPGRLPAALHVIIEAALRKQQAPEERESALLFEAGTLVVRVVPLHGESGTYATVLIERRTRREHLPRAVNRYALTKRETEVLHCIMNGLDAPAIAANMGISRSTVKDYFKALLKKTNARSRSEMLVKIFDP